MTRISTLRSIPTLNVSRSSLPLQLLTLTDQGFEMTNTRNVISKTLGFA